MSTISPQIDSPLRDILYRHTEMGVQGGTQCDFWFVFDDCCLHYGLNGDFEYATLPVTGALPIPRTSDPMCINNPHEQLLGSPLCGIYDDGDDESCYILCFANGYVIHLHTDYLYSDPSIESYRTLNFYTPLRLSDIDYLDFAHYIAQAREQDERIPVKG